MFGLSLTSNLKNAEVEGARFAQWVKDDRERITYLERALNVERGGITRFKVGQLHFDVADFEAQVRGKIDPNIWVESDENRIVVFSGRQLTEAEKNAVVAWMPKPERL